MQDLIDQLAGIAPGSRLDGLRALRPDVRLAVAGSEAAIFEGESGLTRGERHAVAKAVAEWNAEDALAAHHAARAATSPRLPALLAHAEMLTRRPDQATQEAVRELAGAGLAPRDIVMLSQLVAHVNFMARMLSSLRLLERA